MECEKKENRKEEFGEFHSKSGRVVWCTTRSQIYSSDSPSGVIRLQLYASDQRLVECFNARKGIYSACLRPCWSRYARSLLISVATTASVPGHVPTKWYIQTSQIARRIYPVVYIIFHEFQLFEARGQFSDYIHWQTAGRATTIPEDKSNIDFHRSFRLRNPSEAELYLHNKFHSHRSDETSPVVNGWALLNAFFSRYYISTAPDDFASQYWLLLLFLTIFSSLPRFHLQWNSQKSHHSSEETAFFNITSKLG